MDMHVLELTVYASIIIHWHHAELDTMPQTFCTWIPGATLQHHPQFLMQLSAWLTCTAESIHCASCISNIQRTPAVGIVL